MPRYRQQYRRCGKPNCQRCAGGPGHGPYWYAIERSDGRTYSRYIGKERPFDAASGATLEPAGAGADLILDKQASPDEMVMCPRDQGETPQPKGMGSDGVIPFSQSISAAPGLSTGLRIWLLGGFRLERGGVVVTGWRRQLAAAVLKRLLLAEGRSLPRERLALDIGLDQDTESTRQSLSTAIHTLRRILEPGLPPGGRSRYITLEYETFYLHLTDEDWVDLFAFAAALDGAATADDPLMPLASAASIYGGDLLPDDSAPWCVVPREALRLRWHGALFALSEAQVRHGQYEQAAMTLGRLLVADPAQEEAARRLMHVLSRQGRRGEALRIYGALKAALRAEVGARPSAETQALALSLQGGELPARRRLARSARAFPAQHEESPQASRSLVGREVHLARIRDALLAARDGRGSALLVSGDAGMGKTSLAEEAALSAALLGFRILWGRAAEGEQDLPYAPIAEAFRGYVRDRPTKLLRRELLGAEALVTILPELTAMLGIATPRALEQPGAERMRLATALRTLLAATSEQRPLLLVLDDLHWADSSSRGLAAFLMRRCRDLRVVLLCAARDDVPEDHPLRTMILDGLRDGTLRNIELLGLSPAEVATLAQEQLGFPLPEPRVRMLQSQCHGNPFFITELLALLRHESGDAGDVSAGSTLDAILAGERSLPHTIRQTLTRRLDRLGIACRTLLRAGAVLGDRFEIALLAEIVGQERTACEQLLDNAVAARLLDEDRRGAGSYALTHALLCRALYDELLPGQRRRLHARAAAALAARGATGGSPDVERVAYHYARTDEHGKAARWLEQAGDRAAVLYAQESTLRYYERAREEFLQAEADTSDDALPRLDEKLGDQRLLAGDFVVAQADFARARARERDIERRLTLRRKEGVACLKRGDYAGALEMLQAAEDELAGVDGAPPALRATLALERGEVCLRRGDFEAAEAEANAALALLDDAKEQRACGHAFQLLGAVAATRGDLACAEPLLQRSLALLAGLSDPEGDPQALAACWNSLAQVSYRQGDLAATDERIHRGMEIAERLGDQHTVAACWSRLALVARRRGATDEAEEFHRRSLRVRERIGDQHGIAGCWNNIGLLALDRGRFTQADDYFRRAFALFEQIGDRHSSAYAWNNLGHVALGRAALDDATAYYKQALDAYRQLGDGHGEAYVQIDLARVALHQGDPDRAEQGVQASLTGFELVGDHQGLAKAWVALAAIRVEQGRLTDALHCCRRARRASRLTAFPEFEADELLMRGRIHLSIERRPLPARYLRVADALIQRAQRAIGAGGTVWSGLDLRLLTAASYLARGNARAAADVAESVLAVAGPEKQRREESLARRLLGQCALLEGDEKRARARLAASLALQHEHGLRLEAARTQALLDALDTSASSAGARHPHPLADLPRGR